MAKKPIPRKTLKDLQGATKNKSEETEVEAKAFTQRADKSKALDIFSEDEKKKRPRRVGYTFTLLPEVYEALEEAADINKKTKSAVIEKIIQNTLM